MEKSGKYVLTARVVRGATLLVALIAVSLVAVSCGKATRGVGSGLAPTGRGEAPPAAGAPRHAPAVPLVDALKQIDSYPTPKDVSADLWLRLTGDLKRGLVARSKDGKTISIAPAGSLNQVTDLAAASNAAATQATLTWTEVLTGDYNNDGQVFVSDLGPLAMYYMQRTDSGLNDPHRLVVGDSDPEINIADLQPVVNNYMSSLAGYQAWRGHWNGTSVDWDTSFRPNVDNPSNTSFSEGRTATPPFNARPRYTYIDDISGVADKANVRYKVTAYGDGAPGEDSVEATMPPPPSFPVSGTVTLSGTGLAGVTMTLTPGGQSSDTQADGTYTITGVPNGTYTLTPTKVDYTFAPTNQQVTVSGASVTGVNFTSTQVLHSISGTVTLQSAGQAGVLMTLMPGGLTATTQANGTYTITGVASGDYTVTPTKINYSYTPTDQQVTVAGADVTGVDFAATQTSFTISGTVISLGSGLAGVTMTLTPGSATTTTQANGTYSIMGVANGSYTLTPSLAGYVFVPANSPVNVAGADAPGQDFVGNPVQVTGTITGVGAGAIVTLTPGGQNAATNSTGYYVIKPVPDGNYTVTPVKPGYNFAPPSQIANVAGADVTGVDFLALSQDVTGTVKKYDGTPVQGVLLTLTPGGRNALSQADGTFNITAVPSGLYTLTPTKTGCGFQPPNRQTTVTASGASGQDFTATATKWMFLTGGMVKSAPALATDGTVYVGSDDKNLYALNPDGTQKWKVTANDVVETNPCVGGDGTIYFNSKDGKLYALYDTGGVKWSYPAPDTTSSSPALGADDVYFGCDDGTIYSLYISNGNLKWSHPTAPFNAITGSPTVAGDGTMYIGDLSGTLYAFNPDGSTKWTHATGSIFITTAPAIGLDGTVYVVAAGSSYLLALDPLDGSQKWQQNLGGGLPLGGPCVGPDGTVYAVASSTIFALDPATSGTIKWQYLTGGGISSTPRVAPDGTICFGSADFNVYGLNPLDGSVRWVLPTGANVESSAAFATDGTVYIGSDDKNVYAISP